MSVTVSDSDLSVIPDCTRQVVVNEDGRVGFIYN